MILGSSRKIWLAALLTVGEMTTPVRAQDAESTVMKNLYLALASRVPVSTGTLAIFMNPGVVLDPWIETEDSGDITHLGKFTDEAFAANWIYTPSGRSVSKTYGEILGIAQWASVPLSPQQRDDLRDVEHLLFADPAARAPTADYQQYLDLKARRDELQRQFDNSSPGDHDVLASQLEAAREDLKLKGQEAVFVSALGKLRTLQFQKPSDWGHDLQQRFAAAAQLANGTGPFAACVPSIGSLVTSPSWTSVTLNGPELTKDASSGVYVGTATEHMRLLHWGQGATSDPKDAAGELSTFTNTTTISFEYATVSLDRPWMESKLFQSRVWRYPPSSTLEPVSNAADPSTGQTPEGRMPLVATQIVVARNICICGALGDESIRRLRSQIISGKSASWGPFALSGRYYQETEGRTFSARPCPNGVRCDEVQIIGWITQVVPKSPNPDPTFLWGEPAPTQ